MKRVLSILESLILLTGFALIFYKNRSFDLVAFVIGLFILFLGAVLLTLIARKNIGKKK